MSDERVRKLLEKHTKTLERNPEIKQKTVRNLLVDQRFDILNKIYFTGWQPIYGVRTSAEELYSNGMWTPETHVRIGIPSFHKYLPGFVGLLKLEEILDDRVATPEEILRDIERENQRWKQMPHEEKKEQLQHNYDMGLDIDKEDLKKYEIRTD